MTGGGAAVAVLWCIAAQYTQIQRTWSTPLARNPSDSPELCLYLTCYAAGIKGIAVYRCFSEEYSHRTRCDGILSTKLGRSAFN